MNVQEYKDHLAKFSQFGITINAFNLGSELGLFKVLTKENKRMTSAEIADQANLKERYVREWLGCMVAANVISLDGDKYYIPKEHNDILRDATDLAYGAVLWAKRYEQTKACFQKNRPSGYDFDVDDAYWTFITPMREHSGVDFLTKCMLPTLESLPDFRGKLASQEGIEVVDVGCGSGSFSIFLAQKFPNSRFTGIEPCEKPLKIAIELSHGKQLKNLHFKKGDVYNLGMVKKYDLILLFDVLHDLTDPKKALVEIENALKPNGRVLFLEVITHSKHADNAGNMEAAMLYSFSMTICLQCSMQETGPQIGYGACWGKEEMTEAIEQVLKIDKTIELPMLHALYVCSKAKIDSNPFLNDKS